MAEGQGGQTRFLAAVFFYLAGTVAFVVAFDGDSWSSTELLALGFGVGVLIAYAVFALVLRPSDANRTRGVRPDGGATPASDVPSLPLATTADVTVATPEATTPAGRTSSFDFEAFSRRILASDDAIATLKETVGDIRTRQAHAADRVALDTAEGGADAESTDELPPSGVELYLARSLEEAGLFSSDVRLPHVNVVRPRRSGLFFFRIEEGTVAYLSKLRIIELESVLNRVLFAHLLLPDLSGASEEDVVRVNQSLDASIASQAADISRAIHSEDGSVAVGEYALREGLATGIETFQLPYRLTASFRANVSGGSVAIEIDLTPAEAFPKSAWSSAVGRIIPTTASMRRQASSAYALRVGLLVASQAFLCAPSVSHVFVAGVLDTATRHACYYSVDFDRSLFEGLDLAKTGDPLEVYRRFGAVVDPDDDGILDPVRQSFDLEEERFCPSRRYEPVGFSNRELDATSAKALGTSQVAGLAINEEARREQVADDIGRGLSNSTEKNVRLILDLAGADPDPSVRQAARRTVGKLIDGTISEGNALEVEDEFVAGDEMTRSVDKAMELLSGKGHAASKATKLLEDALDPIESKGTYQDDDATSYRFFANYVERALYNRMFATTGRKLVLVPDSYYESQLILASAYLEQDSVGKAAARAARAKELDPLDERARLRLVRCYEYRDRFDLAIDELKDLLEIAHDPEGVGIGFYRMAFMQWKTGNLDVAQACYRKCQQFVSSCYGLSLIELQTLLRSEGGGTIIPDDRIDDTLAANDIPLAPTKRIGEALVECTKASLDSEVFPVARNFASVLGALTGDDVVFDIIRSIELEPDR